MVTSMACYLRRVRRGDINQVVEIDREAFPGSWPIPNYRRELENRLAHYIVVCDKKRTAAPVLAGDKKPAASGFPGLVTRAWRFLNRNYLNGEGSPLADREYIAGFAGIWVLADEAHLTNIAVRELDRRRGVGELLLIAIIDLAAELKAAFVTLEVRISNEAAQRLYRKYGFNEVGVRKKYYTDNREDALLMTTDSLVSVHYQAQFRRLKELYSQRWGISDYRVNQ